MAYANYVLGGGNIEGKREDGILTAEEASLLDFTQTKLLVLSACETGIGDIKGSEGVYGLQRAFKLAGVKYLIVSLWKISEKSTPKFMEIFYNELGSGNAISIAFQKAQLKMKNQQYNPYYWAGFTLIH